MIDIDAKIKDKLLDRTRQMLEASVDEVMTREVLTVDYDDFASKATRMFLEKGILGVLVMKDGHPFSMLTTFDLLSLGYEEVYDPDRDYLRLQVGKLVDDKPLVSVPLGTKLRDAMNIMLDRNIRAIPIIGEDGVIHGMMSMVDMMRWYRSTHNEIKTGKL